MTFTSIRARLCAAVVLLVSNLAQATFSPEVETGIRNAINSTASGMATYVAARLERLKQEVRSHHPYLAEVDGTELASRFPEIARSLDARRATTQMILTNARNAMIAAVVRVGVTGDPERVKSEVAAIATRAAADLQAVGNNPQLSAFFDALFAGMSRVLGFLQSTLDTLRRHPILFAVQIARLQATLDRIHWAAAADRDSVQSAVAEIRSVTSGMQASLATALERVFLNALDPAGRPSGTAVLKIAETGTELRGLLYPRTRVFKGMRYAHAPTGTRRWMPPTPAAPPRGILAATAYGPACPQRASSGAVIGNEDCLRLNIWTPADLAPGEKVPVLFFVHGGGFESTTPPIPFYDGQALSERNRAVVVNVEYRQGMLGFLVHPALSSASGYGGSGNYGLMDVVEGLRWVRRWIPAFGGDPTRVLLFGESAGAIATCTLLASPLATGLFSSAILQSGECLAGTRRMSQQAPRGSAYATKVCPTARTPEAQILCLRQRPLTMLVAAQPRQDYATAGFEDYRPVIDGFVLPESPVTRIASGRHNRVPTIVGSNADEIPEGPSTRSGYEGLVASLFGAGPGAAAIRTYYSPAAFGSYERAGGAMLTDLRFTCPANALAQLLSTSQTEPVHRFLLGHATAFTLNGATHGSELFYVFENTGLYRFSPEQRELAAGMARAWGDFARDGRVAWPRYRDGDEAYVELTVPSIRIGTGLREEACALVEAAIAGR